MTLVEKMARAMAGTAYDEDNASWWKAKAVTGLKAMRDPTEAMLDASNREWDGRMSARSAGVWQAMVDAALTESDGAGEPS